jgi:RND superfamily putative drug exporter
VILLWLTLVGVGFTTGTRVFDRLVSDVGTVPGSQSERAAALVSEASPEPPSVTAVILGPPDTDTALRATVATAVADVRTLPGVAEVSEPLPSATTGRALLMRVTLHPGNGAQAAAQATAERLRRINAASVTIAGGPATADEFNTQAQSDVQRAELLSMPVVLVQLLLVFGGLLAAGLPLLIAGAGVAATFGILYGLSLVSDVSVYAIQVATMLSVGLAVDYALLMVSRLREERAANTDIAAALARTCTTAGRTVLLSGLTVAAALAGLLVFPDPFLRSMGLAGVAVVAVVVLAALTLLPALLALVGRRIKPAKPAPANTGAFARIARTVQRWPLVTALAAAGVMTMLVLPVTDLRLGQVDARLLPASTQTRQLHDAMATHYPALSRSHPIVVVAVAPTDSPQLSTFRDRLTAIPGIADVEIGLPGPVTVLRATTDNTPADDVAARIVAEIRALPAPFEVAVTGDAALLVDYQTMLRDRLPWAIAVVALGTLMLLFLLTGSVLLPIKAVLTNLLSIGAALGAVVWVFQQGHVASWFGTVQLDTTHLSVPVLVGAIAFGLSVDYEVFLLSRIRERWLAGAGAHQAVAEGLQRTGRIVTSAALLLVVVFAGFITGGFVPVQAIGLGLVLAVALDATIVRVLLVPATMTLFGRYNWWAPGPLRRLHTRMGMSEDPPAVDQAAPAAQPAPAH